MKGIASDPMIRRAIELACAHHEHQERKYTGLPYPTHLEQVASWVALAGGTPEMIAAAWCHDLLEDTACHPNDIRRLCGDEVLSLVEELTDYSRPVDGNRAERKRIDREKLAKASGDAQTIKLADLIDNTLSIAFYDPDFARVYLGEKRELLGVMLEGRSFLYVLALEVLEKAEILLVRHQLAEDEAR